MKNIIYIFIAFIMPLFTQAQSKKAFIAEAESAMSQGNYHGAMVYFEEALSFDNDDTVLRYKSANAAKEYGAYALAAKHYHYLLDTVKTENYHDLQYKLGEVYRSMGEYTKAKSYFDNYLSEYSNEDPKLTTKARRYSKAMITALTLAENVDPSTSVTRMGDDINSPDADFAASDNNGRMYYSSMRYSGSSKSNRYKQIAKTLVKYDNINEPIPGGINNRDMSVANFAFNTKGDKVYYSVCEYVNGWATKCKLYSSDVDNQGNFTNESILGPSFNAEDASNTQPSVGVDANGNEVLYFVSNRVGGKGGKDIWMAPLSSGTATNVANINTDGDEITPFYHSGTKTLFFSTDGRDGLGGLDIYSYNLMTNEIEFLPAPNNTSRNDMYYVLDPAGNKGYLTSNRNSSLSQIDSYEACCMDVYTVDIQNQINLDVLTLLQADNSNLNGTRVCLIDETTGVEQCIDNLADVNKASFKLKPNHKYRIVATKDGYTRAEETFMTTSNDKNIVKKLNLSPQPVKLEVLTYDLQTNRNLDVVNVKLIDVTDPNNPKEVVKVNDRGNFVDFDILPGRQYKLVGTKNGYTIATDVFNTNDLSGKLTKELKLKKSELQELLPISLYFDNDSPDPRSVSTKTSTVYDMLTNDYLNREPEYISNFTKGMEAAAKAQAEKEIKEFFADDVKDGRTRLNAFLTRLEQRLAMGEKIELEIRGFASPRAKSDYNKILSARRIDCIKNQMMAYGNGEIKKAFTSGNLVLTDVSYGNTQAKPDVIGDLDDTRNSIYNMKAAKERRVEIINAVNK